MSGPLQQNKDNSRSRFGFDVISTIVRHWFAFARHVWKRDDVPNVLEAETGSLADVADATTVLPSDSFVMSDIKRRDIIPWYTLREVNLSFDVFAQNDSETGNVQQFRITTPDGRTANVVQFSVGKLNPSVFTNVCQKAMDLKSLELSQNCASLLWAWSEDEDLSCSRYITESSDSTRWSVQEWFRKLLSDMALADSVRVGHPYYWHSTVRRRLRREIKGLNRLYWRISLLKSGMILNSYLLSMTKEVPAKSG